MSKIYDRKYYIKKIYFDAAKSIMDNCFVCMKQYIDYKQLNKIYYDIRQITTGKTVYLQDCYGAFITVLCKKLNNEIYHSNCTITVLDSHYSEKIVCQTYIPEVNISIINSPCCISVCKASNLYSPCGVRNSHDNMLIANDFFKKAYK